jgi:hypothetical protein
MAKPAMRLGRAEIAIVQSVADPTLRPVDAAETHSLRGPLPHRAPWHPWAATDLPAHPSAPEGAKGGLRCVGGLATHHRGLNHMRAKSLAG